MRFNRIWIGKYIAAACINDIMKSEYGWRKTKHNECLTANTHTHSMRLQATPLENMNWASILWQSISLASYSKRMMCCVFIVFWKLKFETNSIFVFLPHSNSLRANSRTVDHVSSYMKCTILDLHFPCFHGHGVALSQYQSDLSENERGKESSVSQINQNEHGTEEKHFKFIFTNNSIP